MNNVADFVKDLSQQNVELWVEGDKLRYRAPKEALNSTILNQIKQYKRTIIDLLRKNVDTSKSFPLSYGQQGIWFLYKLAPHTPAYNIAFTARIRSHLNIAALQRALQTLIARHPSLRTTFGQLDAEPFQEVHQYREICIETIDASRWDDSQLRDNAIAAYKRPFDLETGNVIRVNLFTRSPEEYVLILTIHHIAVDGFSFGILLNELRLLYEAENNGSALSLAPVNYSYKDFVQWQNKMLKSPVGDNLSTYWQKQFSGELPLLNIPTDRPRLPVQNYRGACYSFEITNELACKLREIGRGEGATLYMTLLAAFQVLLYRYTGQEDVIVVSPVEGRSKAEFDNIVGFFVNMFPVRVNLAGNPSFIEFLSQVRKTVLTALTNQDYPSTLLLEQLRLNREPSLIGLFPASFNLLKVDEIVPEYELSVSNKTTITKDWAGLKLEPFAIPQQEGQNDLIFDVVETKESLIATFRYSTDLFDETTIKRMVENLQTLLEGIVSNPLSRVASLPMLSQVERNLLKDWNNNRVESPSATSLLIHQLFEDRANKTPNAIAVSFEGQQLTYQELNLRANQLARYLRGLGVKPEMLVGICVERSLDMVVGLLGILKAGGAYVPLDPNYPPERLSYMLTDSGVEVLLTQQSLLGYLPSHAAKVVCIDRDWVTIEQQDGDNFNAVVKQDNLAYIIYTSGSTGKPKGVMISHQALSCFIQSAISEYNITASDRILQFASINFDTAVEEIYPCLCTGATLILRSNEMLADLQKFFQTCADLQLTVLDLPTAYWHQLVADLASSNIALPESLRLVIIGGEKVLPEPVRCWQEYIAKSGKSNNLQLINTYGPTETTVSSTLYRIGNSTSGEAAEVPIGRPLAHSQAYILDKNLQQVPIGVPGELYIGGNTLARGYLNRPEFTKEKFIQNPFSNSSSNSKSQRLYKTGDLVRYLPDGNITFIGRIDNQVKVRGFRMELGEIETVLNSHPQIQQAIVIVHEDIPGEKSLVAYLVLNQSLTIGKLREFIRKKLPDYMVPNAFITLDTLPLTPNGKIDRKALPAGNEKITREQEYVAPRSHGEEIIANIFANLLNVQNVGIHDNFFYLGGHSLLATQLISRLREAFSLEIPLRTLFEYPTVAELEAKLTSLQTTSSGFTLPPVEPRNRNQELHLSWAQERLWFFNKLEGESATYNMSGALRISGNLDINALSQALSEIVRRHEVLRTSFPIVNGTPVQIIHPEATMKVDVVDLQQYPEQERQNLIEKLQTEVATTPFDLENAPLIRCSLLHLSAEEYVLLPAMHHIVSDGWSIGVLLREISTLYQAFSAGKPSPLTELPIQYGDFAVWQKQWLSGEILENQLNYWKQKLDGAPQQLNLPIDHPRTPVMTFKGKQESFEFNAELTQKLKQLTLKSGATLYMTLLAAFKVLLCYYSQQEDIVVGSPISNRNSKQIESLIGIFINTLVIRTDLSGNPTFLELLSRLRKNCLQAYEHQDVPFQQVITELNIERDPSLPPLVQAAFIFQNTPNFSLEMPNLTINKVKIKSQAAKTDLTLSMEEKEEKIIGDLEYNTDLFEPETIAKIIDNFSKIVETIVINQQQTISEIITALTSDNLPLKANANSTLKPQITQEHEYVAPSTEAEHRLAQIWSSLLNVDSVGVKDNFFNLGGHSLLAVRLMSEIQQQFQKNLPLAALFQSPTIEQLAIALRTQSFPRFNKILVPIQQNGSLPPLFCVPGADGQVFNFYHLARYLGAEQPFYGLQAKALDGESLPLDSIEEIATANIQAIQKVQEVGPYFLAGYSLGGHVAFEMATQLQQMGESVAYVGMLDVTAPTSEVARYKNNFYHWDDAKWICEMASGIEEILGENLLLKYETLASLTAEQQINYFKQQLERVGFFPPQTDNKLVSGLLQVFRTRFQIHYVPHQISTTNITLFRAADINFKDINSEEIKSSEHFQNPAWGWNQFCDGEVEIYTVPGDHLSILSEPNVKTLAEKIQKSLEQARNTALVNLKMKL